ncbi:hypothetical protein [Streptomyces sp. NPDC052042]|uniref:hypothetical protein n=1 Tax=Streptomyces sp. NPDC052042 TaxID=3365683 RepID=UPI0037D3F809
MRTAGLTMNDVWADRILRERGVETYRYEGLDADIGVLVESAELRHRGKEENHRPYLHITGELRSITPAEPLPYGISQVTYSPGQGEKVDAFYEFDNEQLVALTRKGYFSRSFGVPEQITGIEWELPATVDALVLAPSGTESESDVPVVFTQVHGTAGLEIDLTSSGYDLTDYFADHSKGSAERTQILTDERALRARSDAINSLFTEDELDLTEQTGHPASPAVQEETEADEVSSGLLQVEAEIAAEREEYLAQRERTAGTPENLYHERVAQALQAGEPEAGQVAAPPRPARPAPVDLDLELELELDEPASEPGHKAPRRRTGVGPDGFGQTDAGLPLDDEGPDFG